MERILEASPNSLTRSGALSIFPGAQSQGWRLPDQGKFSLSSYGLPLARADDLMGILGGFQESAQPESGPDGLRVYTLGSYGSAKLGAVESSGGVLALPGGSEMHLGRHSLCPSGISPTLVGSSIDRFVECAWRWHWIVPLLAEEQRRAGEAEIQAWRDGKGADMGEPYAGYQELCRYVLERFEAIDPSIHAHAGFWSDVIIDVW
ncbi:SUKH-4 family immunity protein [Streptomyces sp. NPDC058665]|uniref:SUKH-4 family immunity protein n=1 Tax=Streptomyces sp. NPDC058665 TaxID=3346586 RepID=UPI00364A866B